MSTFGCCFWWLLLGALIGWLLNYLLCRCSNKSKLKKEADEIKNYIASKAEDTKDSTVSKLNETKSAAKSAADDLKTKTENVKSAAKSTAKEVKKSTTAKASKLADQAKVTIDLVAAKAAGIKIKNADDLTVIEGIGPKINDLFKANGLKTFADVASATVPQMRKILDAGGARFRIANPGTWAKQAKLAANNKWAELKKLQDELSGGIKK